jgi:P27 family predicted phage terminase small subunit
MGLRGRKPKLPHLERLEGNPSKVPILGDFLEASGEAFVPDHLVDVAQACVEVVKASMPDRTYSQADTYLLAAFAEAWAAHAELTHKMAAPDFEWVLTSAEGRRYANPVVGMRNSQAQLLATLGDRLGLNPKARIGLRMPSERPRSKFDGL